MGQVKAGMKQHRVRRWLAQGISAAAGWSLPAKRPAFSKYLIIVAPHTSNWDFVIGILSLFALEIPGCWIGKHTIFHWPFGGVMRKMGGIPVDRSQNANLVAQMVQVFKERETFVLGMAPVGTRRKTDCWKTGFYHIARQADVPVLPAYIDYRSKSVGIGPPFYPCGDIEADFKRLRSFYSDKVGKKPQNQSDIRPGN